MKNPGFSANADRLIAGRPRFSAESRNRTTEQQKNRRTELRNWREECVWKTSKIRDETTIIEKSKGKMRSQAWGLHDGDEFTSMEKSSQAWS